MLRVPVAVVLGAFVGLAVTARAAEQPAAMVNVRAFGAVGDGQADDSDAILAAVAATPAGGTVYFPPGDYKVTRTIALKDQTMLGAVAGGWPADSWMLPTIHVRHTAGPAIRAGDHCSIHGMGFRHYLNTNDPKPKPAPPTILLTGKCISISNCKIWGAYDGIIADGEANIGRVNLENLFLPETLHCGVYLTGALDIPTVRNVEVWSTNKAFQNSGIGFRLGQNDELRMSECFVLSAQTGYLFDGKTWGGLSNCSSDGCSRGVVVESPSELRITNGVFQDHFTSVWLNHPEAVVTIAGSIIQSNGAPAIVVDRCRSLLVSGCYFKKAFENADVFAITLKGGRQISVNGCAFDANGPGISITGDTDGVIITGNQFAADKFPTIVDETPADRRKVIAANL
jgi:hypothetical protein